MKRLPFVASLMWMVASSACSHGCSDDSGSGEAQSERDLTRPRGRKGGDGSRKMPRDRSGRRMSCPTFVEGSSFAIEEGTDRVIVRVTHRYPEGVEKIRELEHRFVQSKSRRDQPQTEKRPNAQNRCPATSEYAVPSVQDIEGGVAVTLTPIESSKFPELKADVAARADRMRRLGIP